MKQISENIYRVVIRNLYSDNDVNSYLIKGENDRFTLLDTGFKSEEGQKIWENVLLEEIVIEKIVLTHIHPDHIGFAEWLKDRLQIPIWMSDKSYEEMKKVVYFIEHPDENPLIPFLLKNGGPGNTFPRRKEIYEFEPDFLFKDGDDVKIGNVHFTAIWTPGHSPDHFCFYNESEKILFSGDHVVQSFNPVVPVEKEGHNALANYFNGLDLIEAYPTTFVLPGHGDVILNLSKRITEIKNRYEKRWKRIIEILPKNGITAYEVAKEIYGENRVARISPYMQTISNLVYLESLGIVTKQERKGTIYYYPKQ